MQARRCRCAEDYYNNWKIVLLRNIKHILWMLIWKDRLCACVGVLSGESRVGVGVSPEVFRTWRKVPGKRNSSQLSPASFSFTGTRENLQHVSFHQQAQLNIVLIWPILRRAYRCFSSWRTFLSSLTTSQLAISKRARVEGIQRAVKFSKTWKRWKVSVFFCTIIWECCWCNLQSS